MKIKFILLITVINLIFTLLPNGLCFAAQPTVRREYISRKTDGVKTTEERVNADYKNLYIGSEDYITISFLDGDKETLYEYDFGLYDDLLQNEISFKSERFQGTEYIKIELNCVGNTHDAVIFPFGISK